MHFFSVWSSKLQDLFFHTIVQFGTIFCIRFISSSSVPLYALVAISLLVGISQRKTIHGVKISSALALISGLIPTAFLIIEYFLHILMLITGWMGLIYLVYNLYRCSTPESRIKHFFAISFASLVSILLINFDAYDAKNPQGNSSARYFSNFWKVTLLVAIFVIVNRHIKLTNDSIYQLLSDSMHEVFNRLKTLF